MIAVIDNYDSFVHNLARYFECAGETCRILRNDAVTVDDIARMNPSAIVISPGPRSPKESGIAVELVKILGPSIPVFGVCLGHQCIGEAYGGRTIRGNPAHGKAGAIHHDGAGVFTGLPDPFNAGRYHSLIVELPENSPLAVTARAADGTIMALRHVAYPVYGVQFHPESVLTEHGMELIRNFMAIAKIWTKNHRLAA